MGAPGAARRGCPPASVASRAACRACRRVRACPTSPKLELRPVQGRAARPVTRRAARLAGVVLPEGEHRDLWVRDGRFTFEPVPGAETVGRGGWLLPGPGRRALPRRASRPAARTSRTSTRRASRRWPTATPGCWRCATAARRSTPASLDDEPDLPRIIRAGRHIAAPRRYIRDLGGRGRAGRPRRRGRAAGPPRRRLGQARRRLDRPRRRRPRARVARRRRWPPRSPRPTRTAPGSPRTRSAPTRCPA